MKKKPSESFPRETRTAASKLFTTPLTKRQISELKALASREKIDYSDIAPVKGRTVLEVGRFYRPVKQLVSLRVDADVLAWYKAQGAGYQTRMNEALRQGISR